MKRLIMTVCAVALVGCASQSQQAQITPEKQEKIKEIGEASAMKLLKTLRGELLEAMQKEGPVGAVEVCSNKAMVLTKQVETETSTHIKRATFKYRNPQNAPDKYEVEALTYFEETLKKDGKLPPYYIQTVKENGKITYRYYKPLKVEGLCLTCHGDKNLMDKQLVEKIEKLYPQDKAYGYKEGDFRGVVRVSIDAEKVR
ncbi:MAG: DUF3365 domain-containing protein [Hydrogenothermaceae bacterium]